MFFFTGKVSGSDYGTKDGFAGADTMDLS